MTVIKENKVSVKIDAETEKARTESAAIIEKEIAAWSAAATMTEEQIQEKVYNDSYVYQEAYDDCCYAIGEVFVRKFKTLCAKVEGVNLNWRGSSGHKHICLEKFNNVDDYSNVGRQLISSLFSGGDFTLECNNYGKGLFFRISHHDCPTGSCYYLTPCARSTYEANS